MKIALVGPGLMPIPPVGWGAIESLIWKYSELLKERGHEVIIFNSQNLADVVGQINEGNFDFIHVHYDEFAHYFNEHCKKPFCITSHYGYILKKERWARGYFSIFVDFLNSPSIIALSPEIKQLYIDAGYKGNSYVLKNGIDGSTFAYNEKGNGKVLCLGKIEPRKQQAMLAKLLEGKMEIDFIGPLADDSFVAGSTTHYLGTWSGQEVREKLTDYSTLILLSDGEAAPLVVIEALMAGVSVVVSRSSTANLDSQKFITILEDDEKDPEVIIKALQSSIGHNDALREEIRTYAQRFDMKQVMDEYEEIIKDVVIKKMVIQSNNVYKHLYTARYYFSRVWLLLSKSAFLRKLKKFMS